MGTRQASYPIAERNLSEQLAEALANFAFQAKDIGTEAGSVRVAGAWVRKTWNTNRAVVHLSAPPGSSDLGTLAQEIKMPLGRALGYFPFFYGLGLQVVWSGADILRRTARLEQSVDKIDNQRCIVQSIFVADLVAKRFAQARTWGQVATGKFQDCIARCLEWTLSMEP